MMPINKGYCYYCGIKVDLDNYEYISNSSNTTIWVCDNHQCQRELSEDRRAQQADEEAQARDERENGWMSY